MNLNFTRPKTETEGLLLSLTKNCATLIKQTHRKAEKTLEFKIVKSKEINYFNPTMWIEGSWMIGLISLEVYISIFNMTEKTSKFELYKFPDEESGGVSYETFRDKIESDLDISDITATVLEDEILAPIFIEECREQVTKKEW